MPTAAVSGAQPRHDQLINQFAHRGYIYEQGGQPMTNASGQVVVRVRWLTFALALLAGQSPGAAGSRSIPASPGQEEAAPQALWIPSSNAEHRTAVGLLYPPAVLRTLISRQDPRIVDERIARAAQAETPIVLMRAIPSENTDSTRSKVCIIEQGGHISVNRIDPLWTEQDLEILRRLDPATSFQARGVIAAFPRAAFVPGRQVVIYAPLTDGTGGRTERWGAIEWDGRGAAGQL